MMDHDRSISARARPYLGSIAIQTLLEG